MGRRWVRSRPFMLRPPSIAVADLVSDGGIAGSVPLDHAALGQHDNALSINAMVGCASKRVEAGLPPIRATDHGGWPPRWRAERPLSLLKQSADPSPPGEKAKREATSEVIVGTTIEPYPLAVLAGNDAKAVVL